MARIPSKDRPVIAAAIDPAPGADRVMKVAVVHLCALAAILTSASSPRAQTSFDGRWWIVVASFQNPDSNGNNVASIRRAARQVEACGVSAFNDWSWKFQGFQPGYDVVVVGGFRDKSAADRALARVLPCVPEAYVKAGRYRGE